MTRLIAFDPAATSSFKNDVIFHILGYLSAAKFKATGHAAHMWRGYSPTPEEFEHAIAAVISLFNDAGGTDKVAKSPAFQTKVIEAARAYATSLVTEAGSDGSTTPDDGDAKVANIEDGGTEAS